MADTKISELNEKTTPVGADLMVIVDTEASPNETKKAQRNNLIRDFGRGWTTDKLLVGAGTGADPTEIAVPTASTVVWMNISVRVLTDEDRTSTLGYTDLDLSAYTSANAKLAIIQLVITLNSITGGAHADLRVKKNGTGATYGSLVYVANTNGDIAGAKDYVTAICGLDSGQVLEYAIPITGTINVTCAINLLGYIE